MRVVTKLLGRIGLTLLIATLTSNLHATTFTAVASGNFTASGTWAGGIAPSTYVTSDVVIIPSGITVTLNSDATFASTSTLMVDGVLTTSTSAYALTMASGSLAGGGTILVDTLTMGMTSGISYTGSIAANTMISTGASITSAANISVNNSLVLTSGSLSLTLGGLSLAPGSTIVLSGGGLSISGTALLSFMGTYNVMYTTSSATAGAELTGSTLGKLTVNIPGGGGVTLTSDIVVNDTLTLTSGTLNLNHKNLTIGVTGDLAASGSGTITSDTVSNITINAANGLAGTLKFTAGSNMAHNFVINLSGSNKSVKMGTNLSLTGGLRLMSGMLNLMANNLSITSNGFVSGGSPGNYIIATGGGTLTMHLGAGNTDTFQVGTAIHYAPMVVIANSGAASGDVSLTLGDTIFSSGTSGVALSATQPVVTATWMLSSTASSINYDLMAMWSVDMEVNSFNRGQAYISHYTGGAWDMQTASSATAYGSMYAMTRAGVTSLSPFAVVDQNAKMTTAVNNVVANSSAIRLYPVPATSDLYFETKSPVSNAVIYDMMGKEVKSVTVVNNDISISELPAGYYNVLLTGKDVKAMQHFIKE